MSEIANYVVHEVEGDVPVIKFTFKVENIDVLDIKTFIMDKIRSIIETIPEDKHIDLTIQVESSLIKQIDKPNVLWNSVFSSVKRVHKAVVETF